MKSFEENALKISFLLQARTAAHPILSADPDFREFLESDAELPRATNTSALSSAGVLRLLNKFGETVNKITFKMEENDPVSIM